MDPAAAAAGAGLHSLLDGETFSLQIHLLAGVHGTSGLGPISAQLHLHLHLHPHPYICTVYLCTRSEELQPTHTLGLSLYGFLLQPTVPLSAYAPLTSTSAAEDDLFSVTADTHRSSINNAYSR